MTESDMQRFIERCAADRSDIRWMGTLQSDGERLSLCGVKDGLAKVVRSGFGTGRTPQEAMILVAAHLDRITD